VLGGEGGGGDLPERSPASQQWMSGSDGLDPAGGQNVYLEEKSSYATQREQEGIARRKAREEREKQMFFKLVKQVPLWRSTQCRAVDAPQPRHVTFAPSISACR